MKPLSRRTLIRGAGGVAIGLPFLEAMRPRYAWAAAQPEASHHVVQARRPDAGVLVTDGQRDSLHPQHGSQTARTYKSKLIILTESKTTRATIQCTEGIKVRLPRC